MFYKKQKKIEELEKVAEDLKREVGDLKEILEKREAVIEELERAARGEKVVSEYCKKCQNGFVDDWGNPYCVINCKCKEFKKKLE